MWILSKTGKVDHKIILWNSEQYGTILYKKEEDIELLIASESSNLSPILCLSSIL